MTVDQPLSYILLQTSTTQTPTEKKRKEQKKITEGEKENTQTVSTMTDIGLFLKGLRETLLQQNIHSISR